MPKHQKNQNKPQNCNLSQQLSCALNDRLSIERVRERNGWKLLLFFFHRTACCWCYQRNSFLLLPSAFFAVFAFLKKFFSNKNEIAVDARADFSGKVKKNASRSRWVGMTVKIFLCCTDRVDNDGKWEWKSSVCVMIDVETHASIIKCNFAITWRYDIRRHNYGLMKRVWGVKGRHSSKLKLKDGIKN